MGVGCALMGSKRGVSGVELGCNLRVACEEVVAMSKVVCTVVGKGIE